MTKHTAAQIRTAAAIVAAIPTDGTASAHDAEGAALALADARITAEGGTPDGPWQPWHGDSARQMAGWACSLALAAGAQPDDAILARAERLGLLPE